MGKLKKKIKNIPGLLSLYRNIKFRDEFNYDRNFFIKNYMYSKENSNTIGYNILLLAHSLEKGMANKKKRYFGKEKTEMLMNELRKYQKFNSDTSNFSFVVGINVLREYLKIYEENNWTSREEYSNVRKFIEDYKKVESINLESYILDKESIMNCASINYDKFLQSRHSIRSFAKKKLDEKAIEKAIDMALKTPTACNRQMCNIYYVKNTKLKELVIEKGQGFSGFDTENINIFIITFDVNSNYFVGERNQGWFNSGLVSMNFVNAMHSLGIGSCFIQFGNSYKDEVELKKKMGIPLQERIAVLIAAGYYEDKNIVTQSPRKKISDIYKVID